MGSDGHGDQAAVAHARFCRLRVREGRQGLEYIVGEAQLEVGPACNSVRLARGNRAVARRKAECEWRPGQDGGRHPHPRPVSGSHLAAPQQRHLGRARIALVQLGGQQHHPAHGPDQGEESRPERADGDEAAALLANGCACVAEGANMPSTPEAIEAFHKAGILFAPGKASNAGGVATSGLEMSQNSLRFNWTREEVDAKLHNIMKNIHGQCVEYGTNPDGTVDYVRGANIAGFVKVADSMLDQGVV